MKPAIIGLAAVLWSAVCSAGLADSATPLTLVRTIPLHSVSGRIDHLAVDFARRRLFVAELGNGTVDVIDLASGTLVRRIGGLREPQGAAYAPNADVLAVATAGDGAVRLFRGAGLAPAGQIDLNDDADNIRFDPRSGNLVVGYGRGGLAVIDPLKGSVVSRIPLQAHPEGFQLDPVQGKAFVNVPDAHQIAIVDLKSFRQTGTWGTGELRANFPLALDQARTVVAVVFRSPPRLAMFDVNSGRLLSALPACRDADDLFFDPRRPRLYVSCGEGQVDVFQQDPSGWRPLASIRTGSGARTSLFVPELDRLFVAARAGFLGLGSEAAILEFGSDQ